MSEPRRELNNMVLEELAERNGSFTMPVLIDIKHRGIKWNYDPSVTNPEQENGHLRLCNNTIGLKYKGDEINAKYYAPCNFVYKPAKEDGKTKQNASIEISCVDTRIIQIIRSIDEDLKCSVVALFCKIGDEEGSVKYTFSKLSGKEFEMGGVTWNGTVASWTLNPDKIMDLNVPRDKSSKFRLNSVMEST